MRQYAIAVVVGSLRKESVNRQLAQALIKLAPAELSLKLLDVDLPLFNQDKENDPPESVQQFKAAIQAADGVVFVTPEYNRSIPGVLKNALDQGSRPYGKSVWTGKPAGVLGASIGAYGSAMAQQHLRNVLAFLDMPTMAQPEGFFQIGDDFLDADAQVNAASRKYVQRWINAYAEWMKKLAA
jgi:chromate reductase